jgi:hypothetical protein
MVAQHLLKKNGEFVCGKAIDWVLVKLAWSIMRDLSIPLDFWGIWD